MPVHNWKPVDANLFHHFHQRWTAAICDELIDRLPASYSALIEQHAAGLVPDVIALEHRGDHGPRDQGEGGTLTLDPPRTRYVIEMKADILAARANQIVIRHRLGEVVCIIEIVSPGNKSSQSAMRAFVEKSAAFLRHGVNLLVIDILPPTPRDPRGIHKAIWDEFEDAPFELMPEEPLTLAAYVAGDLGAGIATRAYVQPIAIGAQLPDMPAYIDRQANVPVPLEATYQTAWKRSPPAMRTLVETGRLPGEEETV